MECKLTKINIFFYRVIYELIDTLWNVNFSPSGDELDRTAELIDTLWNVNAVREAAAAMQTAN